MGLSRAHDSKDSCCISALCLRRVRGADQGIRAEKLSGVFFFFQAEDGIRDVAVTGVQTCALPISSNSLEHGEWFAAAKCRAQSEWGPGVAGRADRGNRGCSSVSFYCMKHNGETSVNTFLHIFSLRALRNWGTARIPTPVSVPGKWASRRSDRPGGSKPDTSVEVFAGIS